jgi:hypothetical protein
MVLIPAVLIVGGILALVLYLEKTSPGIVTSGKKRLPRRALPTC